jgi:hypothetical protein
MFAARLRQAPHESHGQGITLEVDGNDWNAAGRLLGRRQGARPSREDDVHVETNKVDGKRGQPLGHAIGIPVFDDDVLTVRVPELAEPQLECLPERWVRWGDAENRDPRRPRGRLRSGG